jgi:hypothetical protein
MMPEYRAYLIGPDGHFHSSSAIEARDDEGISLFSLRSEDLSRPQLVAVSARLLGRLRRLMRTDQYAVPRVPSHPAAVNRSRLL